MSMRKGSSRKAPKKRGSLKSTAGLSLEDVSDDEDLSSVNKKSRRGIRKKSGYPIASKSGAKKKAKSGNTIGQSKGNNKGSKDGVIQSKHEDHDHDPAKEAAKAWMDEWERLKGVLTAMDAEIGSKKGMNEWQFHIYQAQSLIRGGKHGESLLKYPTELTSLSESIENSLSVVRERENTLRHQYGFDVFENKHKALMIEWEQLSQQREQLNQQIEASNTELEEVWDQRLKELREEVQSRRQDSTDLTPLHHRRESFAVLKAETKEMDLQIGLLLHTLTHARIKATSR